MELSKSIVSAQYSHLQISLRVKGLDLEAIKKHLEKAAIEMLENSSRIYILHLDEKFTLRQLGEILFWTLDMTNHNLTRENACNDTRLGDHYCFTNKQGGSSIIFAPVSAGIDARFFLPQIQEKHSYEYEPNAITNGKFTLHNLDDQRETESDFFDFQEFEFDSSCDRLMNKNQLQGIMERNGSPGFYSERCPKNNLMFGRSYYAAEQLNREQKGNPFVLPYIDEYQSRTVFFYAKDLTNLRDHWETPKELLKS